MGDYPPSNYPPVKGLDTEQIRPNIQAAEKILIVAGIVFEVFDTIAEIGNLEPHC